MKYFNLYDVYTYLNYIIGAVDENAAFEYYVLSLDDYAYADLLQYPINRDGGFRIDEIILAEGVMFIYETC